MHVPGPLMNIQDAEGANQGDAGAAITATEPATQTADAPNPEASASAEVQPLKDITNKNTTDGDKTSKAQRAQRERRERGPPADGIPSKTKVMVANLPYDLTEEKVRQQASFLPFSHLAYICLACRAFQGLPALVC